MSARERIRQLIICALKIKPVTIAIIAFAGGAAPAHAAQPGPLPGLAHLHGNSATSEDGAKFLFSLEGRSGQYLYDVATHRRRRVDTYADLTLDGRHLIYGKCRSATQCSLVREDLRTHRRESIAGYSEAGRQDKASRDGRYVFACRMPCENSVGHFLNSGILDMQTRHFVPVFRHRRHHDLWPEALSPDGRTAAYSDLLHPQLYLFTAATGHTRIISQRGATHGSQGVQLSDDGHRIFFTTADNAYALWSATTGKSVALPGAFRSLSADPMTTDGSQVVFACGTSIFLRDSATGDYRRIISDLRPAADATTATNLMISGNGRRVFYRSSAGYVSITTADAEPVGTTPPAECKPADPGSSRS
jgi:hypothetical protein